MQDAATEPAHDATMKTLGEVATMVAGRLMEAWLIDRAEERDAGRAIPSWVEPGRVGAAAVLPDRCRPSELEMRGAASGSLSEAEVGVCPARTARGRRRWD